MTARRRIIFGGAAFVAHGVALRARGQQGQYTIIKTARGALHQRRHAAAVAQVDVDIRMGQQPLDNR